MFADEYDSIIKAWKKEKCRNSEVEHAQDLGVSRDFPEGRK